MILCLSLLRVQSQDSKTFEQKSTTCTLEMTTAQLTAKTLRFKCPDFFDDTAFGIDNFIIKFKGYQSIAIKGIALNSKAKALAELSNSGDYVSILRIENFIVNGKKHNAIKTLLIKIKTP